MHGPLGDGGLPGSGELHLRDACASTGRPIATAAPAREQGTITTSAAPSDHTVGLSDLVDRVWIDRLVNLQVLAAHGDLEAAVVAEQWLEHDPEARALWVTVADRCQQVRFSGADG